ncbi:TPA: hypothetical protein ACGOPE_000954 [Streptococcus suis]
METLYLFAATMLVNEGFALFAPENVIAMAVALTPNTYEIWLLLKELVEYVREKLPTKTLVGQDNTTFRGSSETHKSFSFEFGIKWFFRKLRSFNITTKIETKESIKNENNTIMERQQEKSSPADAEEQ